MSRRSLQTASFTGDTCCTSHRVFGQQSSVDELLKQAYLFVLWVCCLGRARTVLVVASDLFLFCSVASRVCCLLICFACCALLLAILVSSHLVLSVSTSCSVLFWLCVHGRAGTSFSLCVVHQASNIIGGECLSV